ncbi:MAG: hypothetical protein ACRDH5_19725 [bacterium]
MTRRRLVWTARYYDQAVASDYSTTFVGFGDGGAVRRRDAIVEHRCWLPVPWTPFAAMPIIPAPPRSAAVPPRNTCALADL